MNPPLRLLQIVPTLPPVVSGVGDYAVLLARRLRTQYGVESEFVVGDPTWRLPAAGHPEFPVRAVPARTAAALAETLRGDAGTALLLHYVPYGYAPRGCPFWLVEGLRRLRPARRLVTVFHELSADNESPWKTAFWLSPFQRRLGRQLGQMSSVRRMTTRLVAEQMRAMLPADDRAVEACPVFSNLGEPERLLPLEERKRRVVVFGTRTWREEVYGRHREALVAACRHLGAEGGVLDVGAPLASPPTGLAVPFAAHGLLRTEDAPAMFGGSLAGFFTYPVPFLGKSGIFAAYCAFGLVPVTTAGNCLPNDDGLEAGVHYLPGTAGGAPAEIARAAQAWYRQHDLGVHAEEIYRALAVRGPRAP